MTSKKENNKSSMPKWLNELDWDKMSQSKKIGIIAAGVFILLLLAAIGGGAKPPEQGGTTNQEASFIKSEDGTSYDVSSKVVDMCDAEAISKGYTTPDSTFRLDHPAKAYDTGEKVDGVTVYEVRSAIGFKDKEQRKKQGLEENVVYMCDVVDKEKPEIVWLSIDGKTVSGAPVDSGGKSTPTPTPKVTKEQENAQKSAEGYAMMNMSRQGIIDQLVFDKFSKADAEWAVKQLDEGVSWKENALGSAKTYYGKMNMSKSAVYDQLLFDKFTKEEAQYAIDNL